MRRLLLLGERPWQVAEWLYEEGIDRLRTQGLPLPTAEAEAVVQRIYRVLTDSARTLEGTLPRALRDGHDAPRLRVDWDGQRSVARWEDVPETEGLDIARDVVLARCEDIPDFDTPLAEVLSGLLVKGLIDGSVVLPGFVRADESTANTIWLKWQAPVVE